jgi:hypothetical protein
MVTPSLPNHICFLWFPVCYLDRSPNFESGGPWCSCIYLQRRSGYSYVKYEPFQLCHLESFRSEVVDKIIIIITSFILFLFILQLDQTTRGDMIEMIQNEYGVRLERPSNQRITRAWDRIQIFVSFQFIIKISGDWTSIYILLMQNQEYMWRHSLTFRDQSITQCHTWHYNNL